MRCSAIAAEAVADGCGVVFAVSDEASRALVEGRGFRCEVVGGSYRQLGVGDADLLAELASSVGASSALVDSYAASGPFFSRLAERGLACTCMDDAYTFDDGFSAVPVKRDVAAVVNYGFGFGRSDYEAPYRGSSTALHIGPEYAPVREGFRDTDYLVRREVGSVLVTSGMTNPNRALERMATGCRAALPGARITVVVGGAAHFDGSCLSGTDFEVVENAQDMPGLMAGADLAVSAAGTTLYELACVGVPMVAAPIVDNQVGNAKGIADLGLGRSLKRIGWTADDVRRAVSDLARSYDARCAVSAKGRELIDGRGARRIYDAVKSAVL